MLEIDVDQKQALLTTLKIVRILKDKFGCTKPAFALYQIKRQMRAGKGRYITAAMIKRWGR